MKTDRKVILRRYRENNRAEIAERRKKFFETHPDAAAEYQKRWARKNRLVLCLRHRVREALKSAGKSAATLPLLGMDISEYRIYLQGQFTPEMNWENYGKVWHVDHIKPCATFDLTKPENQRECFNWSNTQPLLVSEHKKKHGRKSAN